MLQKTFLVATPCIPGYSGELSVSNFSNLQSQFDAVDTAIENHAKTNNLSVRDTKLITIAGNSGGEITIGYSVLFQKKSL